MSSIKALDAARELETTTPQPRGRLLGEFGKYFVVGGVAFAVDFGILVSLTELAGLHYLAAAAIAFLAGLLTNYLLSIGWVFHRRALADRQVEFLLFAAVGILGLGMNQICLYLGTGVLGADYRLSKIATVAVVFVWNFAARKALLFS